jgi:nucleotidyltransferase/DNA polymerase involved in DNA repair
MATVQVACLLIEHFDYQIQAVADPSLRGRPVIIGDYSRGVVDISKEAEDHGITVGMPLRQALARTRNAVLIEPDLGLYHRSWKRILDTLHNVTPLVEDQERGLAFVSVDGLERLYKSETNLLRALQSAVPAYVESRLGLAPEKFPAYVAAWDALPDRAFKAPEDLAGFLSPKTIHLLPVEWGVRDRLDSFGLGTLGKIASQQVGPLQAQFGPTGRLIWELAQGINDQPLKPYRTEDVVEESLVFPTPTASMNPLLVAIRWLLERAYRNPQLRGRFARAVDLRGDVLNKRPWVQRVTFREALGDADRAFISIKFALDDLALPGALEGLSLNFTGITGEAGAQLSFNTDVRRRENLAEALRQVRERTEGRTPIYRVQEMEPWSRHPERRHVLVEYAV